MIKNVPFLLILLLGCSSPVDQDPQRIVDEAIAAHGSFSNKQVSFHFRDRHYSVNRSADGYTYTRSWADDSLGQVKDILENGRNFIRTVENDTIELSDEWVSKYKESVNSVLYFFQLPNLLNDNAVIKQYVGEFKIKGKEYWGVKVTFRQEGGGKDFEDEFLYWFHKESKMLDYFAYAYQTEGGGVRFREAINRREIKGLVVQDYVNYKAEKDAKLESLPSLFENGKLENLSLINNEKIKVEIK